MQKHESFDRTVDRFEEGGRSAPTYCHCGQRATERKPVCIDHIFELEYAARLAEKLQGEPLKLAMADVLTHLQHGPLSRRNLMQRLADHPYTRTAALARLQALGKVVVERIRLTGLRSPQVMVRLAT